MGTSQSVDVVASSGVPPGLEGEQRERLAALARKAAETMPPPFDAARCRRSDEVEETAEGARAEAVGAAAIARRRSAGRGGLLGLFSTGGYPTRKMVEAELGGVEAMFTVFGLHYCRMFADPRMNVLFDTRHADTNVSALEHGKRVASALMDRWYGTRYFRQLDRGSAFFAVGPTHQQAKHCPMRPATHRRAGRFTVRQRNAWIGHVCCGAEEAGASEEFRTRLADWLAANIGVYAPFLDEGTGSLVD